MSRRPLRMLALVLGGFAAHGALAQHDHGTQAPAARCTPEHAAMGHCTPAEATPADTAKADRDAISGCTPEHAAMGHCTPTPAPRQDACPPAHAAMGHCTPERNDAPLAPREPIPPLTDVDRAAAFPALSHAGMAHGPPTYGRIRIDRLEAWDGRHARGQAWEADASYGGDLHRAWLRTSGSREDGRTTASNVELRYARAVARWWDVVAGVRHDFRPTASRTRAALGVQGLAPYQFEVSAVAYLGGSGDVAVELEAEYDLRFGDRLILQPALELALQAGDDPARGLGSGLSKAGAGLRLRYEVTRRFAPYLGIVHERAFGDTAGFHEAAGEPARDTRAVAGVRLWF